MIKKYLLAALAVVIAAVFAGSTSAQTAIRKDTATEQPAVISAVAPYYPADARAHHATGSVVVEVSIDAKGEVASTTVMSGHPAVRRVCERAAKNWRFAPLAGSAALRTVRVTFKFSIIDGDRETTDEDREHELVIFTNPYLIEIGVYTKIIHTQDGIVPSDR
jgi:TonB family protein